MYITMNVYFNHKLYIIYILCNFILYILFLSARCGVGGACVVVLLYSYVPSIKSSLKCAHQLVSFPT